MLVASLLAAGCRGVPLLASDEGVLMSPTSRPRVPEVKIEIKLVEASVAMGHEIGVRWTLRNDGNEPVIVNKRFLVNDKAAPPEFRELYFTIRTPGGGTAPFAWELKVGFPDSKDFRRLKPGAAIRGSADLNDLYLVEEEGIYYVRATYQNVHAGPTVFDDATGSLSVKDRGAVRIKTTSEKLRFRITG